MKKIMCFILSTIAVFALQFISKAEEQPFYDPVYNSGQGALYANGTDIVIKEDSNRNTIVSWNDGNQIVPETISIFGGGTGETLYDSSNIRMLGGKVSFIYGGGISLDENKISKVGNANVIVNGGTVLQSVYGGGLIYSETDNANVVIDGGTVMAVSGGGAASANISGVPYSAGTKENPENSKNRVELTNVIINQGNIKSNVADYGLVNGGGQGYSFVRNANLTINGGDLSKAYVTSGGANGYTANTITKISGGKIYLFQNVNRGIVKEAVSEITGGEIAKVYLGGETEDTSVDGKISKISMNILNGNIKRLEPGTSVGKVINVDRKDYNIIYVNDSVEESNIGENEIKIDYTFDIIEKNANIYEGESMILHTKITTNPAGYESLFADKPIVWNSNDRSITDINQDGTIVGKEVGSTVVTAELLNHQDSIDITVEVNRIPLIIAILLGIIVFSILFFGIILGLIK